MAGPRRFEIDELLVRPGTYFNPQTEVLIVVDDSAEIDQATLEAEREGRRGRLGARRRRDAGRRGRPRRAARALPGDLPRGRPERGARRGGREDLDDEEDELEPDPDVDELE